MSVPLDPTIQTRRVLGIDVANLDVHGLADRMIQAASTGRGGQVFALNVHTYTETRRDRSYRDILSDSFLVFADGVPILWAARIEGNRLVARTHGHDLMMETLRQSAAAGVSQFFLGGTEETLELLTRRLLSDFPALRIAGSLSPPFRKLSEADLDEIAARINRTRPGILWVALGAPRQERWIHAMRSRLHVPVLAGVGAAFEIVAGRFVRAPRWMQRLGLEWVWRLGQDPARLWRRYLSTNGYFLGVLLLGFVGRLFRRGSGPPP